MRAMGIVSIARPARIIAPLHCEEETWNITLV
jgi:hypothetical protein